MGETGRGDEAVELVASHQPDLAILDIKMPGMDGMEAAREIIGDRRVAVLILTAFSQRNLIEEARDAGVVAYLVKPFQRGELRAGHRRGHWPRFEEIRPSRTSTPGCPRTCPPRGQTRDPADGRPGQGRPHGRPPA